jgi:hypothetical protein
MNAHELEICGLDNATYFANARRKLFVLENGEAA